MDLSDWTSILSEMVFMRWYICDLMDRRLRNEDTILTLAMRNGLSETKVAADIVGGIMTKGWLI